MDSRDVRLLAEEQHNDLRLLRSELLELKELNKKMVVVAENPQPIKVEQNVEVKNLQTVVDGIGESLGELIEKIEAAIIQNSYEPLTEIKVSNLLDAKADSVKINNFPDFAKFSRAIIDAIKENQPIIKVDKQEVQFPTDAKDAIPVRLSDGKNFYKAIAQAVQSVAPSYIDESGKITPVTLSGGAVPITGSITATSSADADYGFYQEATSGTYTYYGFTDPDANWLVKREDTATETFGWATVTNNPATTTYSTAWTNRASLSYGRKDEAF